MSLDGDYDDTNIFAKMIRGEAPCARIYEDAETLAFLDLFPQSRGHALVISKTARARNLLDVEPAALRTLIATVQKVARGLETALSPDGLVVTQFNGAAAGQTVFHLHFHVIPVYGPGGIELHARAMADATVLAEHAERVRGALVAS